jgi:hypothetical protein
MQSTVNLEKLVITNPLPDAAESRTSHDDWERVWRLSPTEVFRYAESARVVSRELGLRRRPVGDPAGNLARN